MFNMIGKYIKNEKRMLIKRSDTDWTEYFCRDSDKADILFTGEIYNLADLLKDLPDIYRESEVSLVVLKYYKLFGIDKLLSVMNGIFAFAILDAINDMFYLIRDHMGIYPLYYYETAGEIYFSSEVKSFLENGITAKLSYEGFYSYMANQSAQEPFTLIQGINALGAGGMLVSRAKKEAVLNTYWNPAVVKQNGSVADSFEDAGMVLKELLFDAVKIRDNEKHKTGILLSGGIDSSAIVSISRILKPKDSIHTFTVTHDNSLYDEGKYAHLVARQNRTIEHNLHISGELISECIYDALDICDQPSLDGINTFFSTKLIKDYGFDAIVSGLGGEFFVEDDVPTYLKLKKYQGILRYLPDYMGDIIDGLTNDGRTKKISMLIKSDDAFFANLRLLSDGQIRKLISPDVYRNHKDEMIRWSQIAYRPLIEEAKDLPDYISKKYFYESRTWHVSTLLKDVMQNSIKQGGCVRFPLMDYRLVEYLFHLPLSSKADFRTSKVHLVNASEGGIPSECIYRKKMGFVFPFVDYLKSALRDEMVDFFTMGNAYSIFNKKQLKYTWTEFMHNREHWEVIWKLFILDRWMNKYNIDL